MQTDPPSLNFPTRERQSHLPARAFTRGLPTCYCNTIRTVEWARQYSKKNAMLTPLHFQQKGVKSNIPRENMEDKLNPKCSLSFHYTTLIVFYSYKQILDLMHQARLMGCNSNQWVQGSSISGIRPKKFGTEKILSFIPLSAFPRWNFHSIQTERTTNQKHTTEPIN